MAATKYESKIGKECIYTYFKNRLKYGTNVSKQSIMNIGSTRCGVKCKLYSRFMVFFSLVIIEMQIALTPPF